MVAVPGETAVATPDALTVAMCSSDDDHVNDTPVTGLPFASATDATYGRVSPSDVVIAVFGERMSAFATCCTVTGAVAGMPSTLAVIVAEPLAFAVTVPLLSTDATPAFDVEKASDSPVVLAPVRATILPLIDCVSPSDAKFIDAGVSSM